MLKIKTLQTSTTLINKTAAVLGLGIAALSFSSGSSADILAMPDETVEEQSSNPGTIALPRRGLTQSQIRSQYGEPSLIHPTIGDPPITRWDYDGFSVFFEYQHVLHSVVPEKPKPIFNKEQLQSGY